MSSLIVGEKESLGRYTITCYVEGRTDLFSSFLVFDQSIFLTKCVNLIYYEAKTDIGFFFKGKCFIIQKGFFLVEQCHVTT
jgi:hypothetical protein